MLGLVVQKPQGMQGHVVPSRPVRVAVGEKRSFLEREFHPKTLLLFYPFSFLLILLLQSISDSSIITIEKITKCPRTGLRIQTPSGWREDARRDRPSSSPRGTAPVPQRRAPRLLGRWLYPAHQVKALRAASAALLLLGWLPWL